MSSSPVLPRRQQTSPATTPTSPNGKPETFLEYLGTIGRRKKMKEGIDRSIVLFYINYKYILVEEVQNIEEEGRQAIDSNAQHPIIDALPEEFVLGNYRGINSFLFKFIKF
jgi:hypothetical protein